MATVYMTSLKFAHGGIPRARPPLEQPEQRALLHMCSPLDDAREQLRDLLIDRTAMVRGHR